MGPVEQWGLSKIPVLTPDHLSRHLKLSVAYSTTGKLP